METAPPQNDETPESFENLSVDGEEAERLRIEKLRAMTEEESAELFNASLRFERELFLRFIPRTNNSMNLWIILCLLCASTLFCRATPEQDIKDYYQKLNFVALLSTDDERAKIEARQGPAPLYGSDPRLSLVEKYLDELGAFSVDPRSRDVRKGDVSHWKNPTVRTWAQFVYKAGAIEKRGDSYFIRLQSITSDDVNDQASLKGYLKKVPDLSEVPSLIDQLGNWNEIVITELDEWKVSGETWQVWRVGSSMTYKGKGGAEIKIPEE